jgi:hypothetical protein
VIETDESQQRGVMTFAWSQRIAGLNSCPLAAARMARLYNPPLQGERAGRQPLAGGLPEQLGGD